MAQQTTVRFIDDLDGSDAAGTFDFAIGARQYQIDLSDENAAKLRDALAPHVGAARKAAATLGVRPAASCLDGCVGTGARARTRRSGGGRSSRNP